MNDPRFDGIRRAMGGSDYKTDKVIKQALAMLPPVVLLSMTEEDIASFCHNIGAALAEAWRLGFRAGERH